MSRCSGNPDRDRAVWWRAIVAISSTAIVSAVTGVRVAESAAAQRPARARSVARSASKRGPDTLLVSSSEYTGWKYFHVYCYRCHGVDAFGGQLAPDLRRSVSSQGSVTHDVFLTTVKEGRIPKGMPAWSTLLTDDQIEGLYAYVKARSDRRLGSGRPHQAADPPAKKQ